MGPVDVSVILPAHNEAGYLPACIPAVLRSDLGGMSAHLTVVANGCSDNTAEVARSYLADAQAQGWRMKVIDTPEPGKLNALQLGDDAVQAAARIYLDADVAVDPGLVRVLAQAVAGDVPLYASGSPRLAPAKSRASRAFGRFWETLPFVTDDTPGFGVYALNAAGRARWGTWPAIISDDGFARLNFAPQERVRVNEGYTWPLVEGFANLVRVRRRQNQGVDEIRRLFPHLCVNDTVAPPGALRIARLALARPVAFAVYASVAVAVRTPLFAAKSRWERGR